MLGLSGGIDSALVACLAVDALGAERVARHDHALPLLLRRDPGRRPRARRRARRRSARAADRGGHGRLRARRSPSRSPGAEPDLTEENLQARIRGNLLMALSNKFGWLVLTTGNKSEMSVGYTTLYGDLAGGFAVIKDVPKTLVYRLCEWRNSPAGAPGAAGEPPRAPAPIPAIDHRARALGRAAPRPARRGLAAALRGARPDPPGLRRARPEPRAADRPGAARSATSTARSGSSTSPSTSAARRRPGSRSPTARVRPRPAHADHQPLPRLSAAARPARARCVARRAPAPLPLAGARAARSRSPAAATRCRTADPPQHARGADRRALPRVLARRRFHGLAITEVTHDPGGAFSVQYGNCLQGGQGTCVPPLRVVTSPDNSFLPGGSTPAHDARDRARRRRASAPKPDAAIAIPTGGVVVDIYARDAALARAAARSDRRRSTGPAAPAKPLPPRAARHRLRPTPLPSQAPPPLHAATAARGLGSAGGRGGRTAIVMRVTAHSGSSSSLKRTSQTQVVRPAVQARGVRVHVPVVIGRRKLVLLDRPIAISPCSAPRRRSPARRSTRRSRRTRRRAPAPRAA